MIRYIIVVGVLLASCSSSKVISEKMGATQDIMTHQEELNEKYSNPVSSPLREKAAEFKGHQFYPIDLGFRVEAKVTCLEDEPFFEMPTSGTMTPEYRKYAYLDFEIKGKSYRLTVLQNKQNMISPLYRNYLFLPFQDQTNGDMTYGGGRYIDLKLPLAATTTLDFNQSYHPYCAYTDGYNCPIPPAENRLDVAIEAGIILNEEYRH